MIQFDLRKIPWKICVFLGAKAPLQIVRDRKKERKKGSQQKVSDFQFLSLFLSLCLDDEDDNDDDGDDENYDDDDGNDDNDDNDN